MHRALVLFVLTAGCLAPGPSPAEGVTYDAIHLDTVRGGITAIVFCDDTPLTCVFMRGLIDAKYYDGRAFGRVIPGFVIQEVDRTGGTSDQTQKVPGEFGTRVSFSAGAFGIARDADPDSGSSEFFIMDLPTSRLYGNYTAFAQVIEGLDVVHAIARVPALKTGPASSVGSPLALPLAVGIHDRVPIDPPVMTKVTWTSVTLAPEVAARYPIQVGETYATDTVRATLEWPRDLASGRASQLGWGVAPRDTSPTGQLQDAPPLDLAGATMRFDGAATGTLAFAEDPQARGWLAFTWTPPAAGSYRFYLEKGKDAIATGDVLVGR